MSKVVTFKAEGNIGEVILSNPAKLNAMSPAFEEQIQEAFEAADADENVRVVILWAEGKVFSAGLDLMGYSMSHPEMTQHPAPAGSKPAMLKIIRDFQAAISSAEKCKKPVIAAVQGWCIGGGLDLIAACDIRIATADAKFSLREARIGLMSDLGSLQRLPHIIGEGHTRQLAFTTEDISAERAEKIGLVNDVYPDFDSMMEAARNLAETIAANAPLAVQGSKEVMNYNRGRTVEESLEYVAARNTSLLPSEDLIEAIGAFMEKRTPNFKGK